MASCAGEEHVIGSLDPHQYIVSRSGSGGVLYSQGESVDPSEMLIGIALLNIPGNVDVPHVGSIHLNVAG